MSLFFLPLLKTKHFVFFTLISKNHLSVNSFNESIASCNPSLVSDNSTKSSAYNKHDTCCSPKNGASLIVLLKEVIISLINKLNNDGLRLQPCLCPTSVSKYLLIPPPICTQQDHFEYISIISFTKPLLIPTFSNLKNNPFLHTES